MDTHKKLSQSPTFRAAFFIPIVAGAATLGFTSLSNGNYTPCFNSECLNNFFNLYKYPLSLMGLAVPLSAIAAALHRSEETSLQIRTSQYQLEETLKQNIFNNYIKHKEEFFELLTKIEGICNCKFNDPLSTYKKIFPNNSYQSLTFKSHAKNDDSKPNEFLTSIHKDYWTITAHLLTPESSDDNAINFLLYTSEICSKLNVSRNPNSSFKSENSKLVWPDECAKTSQKNIQSIIMRLSSFSAFQDGESDYRTRGLELMRAKDAWRVKEKNCGTIDNMTVEIDEFL